ncbi:MAG TPA: type II toxin-antitoxin system Phd/YefM family antitoxin [Thioploca sp.]|nr:MAG: type II toxin-antitoxin system Phd/YefM family antitoxin [Gammaproteobacteria bacterium]HDN27704.1 type II toxin-antitoxin system Phd/YefM family antitoxin [Thioploca sp.]
MEASVVDLRNKTNDILKALDRFDEVKIFYRGKIKGIIKSVLKTTKTRRSVCEHPFFNCLNDDESVEEQMDRIRGGRYS